MSYEYTIKIYGENSTNFMRKAESIVEAANFLSFYGPCGEFLIKDPCVTSSWTYDISLKKEDQGVHIVLVGWSFLIYKAFREALSGLNYEISDDCTNVSLEEMFRIKN